MSDSFCTDYTMAASCAMDWWYAGRARFNTIQSYCWDFSNPFLASELAFRGGTALHKLFFHPAARYSEDIDLVRTTHGGIKEIIDALRKCLGSWLGEPKTRQTSQSFKLLYQFAPEMSPSSKQKIKVEINIQESFSILERLEMPYSVESDWFRGNAKINTFQFEELLATKLRALYERKKDEMHLIYG